MTGPISLRRLSQLGPQLAKVTPRGSIVGRLGPMSLPPKRDFKVVANPALLKADGTFRSGGHVAIVAEPGDHYWVEDKNMSFGHHATSNVPTQTKPDLKTHIAKGQVMPPNSMNVYPGSGMVMEHSLSEGDQTIIINLGPLTDKEAERFAEFVNESYTGAPIDYQRAGVDAPNCVTMVARALERVFEIDSKKIAPKPLEMPVNYVARVGPAVSEHVREARLEQQRKDQIAKSGDKKVR